MQIILIRRAACSILINHYQSCKSFWLPAGNYWPKQEIGLSALFGTYLLSSVQPGAFQTTVARISVLQIIGVNA